MNHAIAIAAVPLWPLPDFRKYMGTHRALEVHHPFSYVKSTGGITGYTGIEVIDQMFDHVCVFVHDIRQDGEIIIVDNRVDLFVQGTRISSHCFFNFCTSSCFDRISFKIDKEKILLGIIGQPIFKVRVSKSSFNPMDSGRKIRPSIRRGEPLIIGAKSIKARISFSKSTPGSDLYQFHPLVT